MEKRYLLLTVLVCLAVSTQIQAKLKRSIDLIMAQGLISEERLPKNIIPTGYKLDLYPVPSSNQYSGRVFINITWQKNSDLITLHLNEDVRIDSDCIVKYREQAESKEIKVMKCEKSDKAEKKSLLKIHLEKSMPKGTEGCIEIAFSSAYTQSTEGIFMSLYIDPATKENKHAVATHFGPNWARRVFPCFDEPGYKVPFLVSVARQKDMSVLANMNLDRTEPMKNKPDWFWDHFKLTPPMSTYNLGIVISEFSSISLNTTKESKTHDIKVWARPDFITAVQNVTEKVEKAITVLEEFLGTPYPLPKLDIVAIPNYPATKPADNWGLILFKESELSSKGCRHLTQELVYQWIGSLVTPAWWNEAHINHALVRYITAYTTITVGKSESFNNWPMTMLYSIYYEFSKRYPHGKNTVIKQDSMSAKTELVFRMLNYTLGEKTFKLGLQKFIKERQFKTFTSEDIWNAISEQAKKDGTLDKQLSVYDIATSWSSKDRLPVLTVIRNYNDKTATLTQRIYLRERPHDVPDQDKFVWWIPIVYVRQDKMNFENTKPAVWMKKEPEITLSGMPNSDLFVIVNPEEIGPFPVNYDAQNWNLIARYLCGEGRLKIPVNTRAKLMHDAWNLAYAGELSFATALNMTMFLKYEREHLTWDPVFTLIDHIGRHIDSSDVHRKFQAYVRSLLTPLYEELGSEPKLGECEGRAHLRSSSKIFLCQVGYKPCIEEAQAAFKKWMEIENPDEGNPLANQYICPVFKWGSKEEWEFGLQRVIKFPANRKQSERTYLLKTLAGCPNDNWKIERLLNITVLEQNGNFSDNDISLIFSMLTGSANGYTSLFNFLKKNWDLIKIRFEGKTYLWNSLITSATTVFKTQEGLDMVSELYVQRQNEFGTADFVIEKALKNIQEETKWSNENLPVIEKWLDNYLRENKQSSHLVTKKT